MNRRRLIKGGGTLVAAGLMGDGLLAAPAPPLTVPPEESQHQRTFMQWPASREVHEDSGFLGILQQTIAGIANSIADFEPVTMLAAKSDHSRARKLLGEPVELWDVPTEDLWCRDSGPLFARQDNGKLAVSHIRFNGWGNRQVHQRDGRIAETVAAMLDLPIIDSGVIGEAGGVEHDGHGLLMAHESSWVHDNRNPGLSREEIGKKLLAAYGATRIIWSPGLRDADITDYHIDSLARFTGPGRVLINMPGDPDPDDPFHRAAMQTRDALVAAGLSVDIIPEPVKRRVRNIDFVASYANYYVCNGAVIAAQFGDKETDATAQAALKRHFPGREIVTLNVDALGEIGGGIHCSTQQMPA